MVVTTLPGLSIRTISEAELAIPLQWAAEEGWNPGLADAGPFHAADPDGFLMAFLGDEPVGCISVVRYDATFGFLGLYIVRPDHRGRGYGLRLWQAGLVHLDGCVVGLDGVVAQQANYARSGFAYAYRNVRFAGVPTGASRRRDIRVTPMSADRLDAVVACDRRFFPAPRAEFLRGWLAGDDRKAFAFAEDGMLRGYCVVRSCRVGCKIGPLFAETPEAAEALFEAAVSQALNGPVAIDAPEPNRAAGELARRYGLTPVFETARMYRGPPPDLPLDLIYGVTTLELG
jgi:hypothetical protein